MNGPGFCPPPGWPSLLFAASLSMHILGSAGVVRPATRAYQQLFLDRENNTEGDWAFVTEFHHSLASRYARPTHSLTVSLSLSLSLSLSFFPFHQLPFEIGPNAILMSKFSPFDRDYFHSLLQCKVVRGIIYLTRSSWSPSSKVGNSSEK
jgi:hypothetical protein